MAPPCTAASMAERVAGSSRTSALWHSMTTEGMGTVACFLPAGKMPVSGPARHATRRARAVAGAGMWGGTGWGARGAPAALRRPWRWDSGRELREEGSRVAVRPRGSLPGGAREGGAGGARESQQGKSTGTASGEGEQAAPSACGRGRDRTVP